MSIHNGLDLLELCMATDASSFLADTIVMTDEDVEYEIGGGYTSSSSGSDSEYEESTKLPTATFSVNSLCQKLKKINPRFSYSIVNDCDEWSTEHASSDLSPAKKQRDFCTLVMK